MEPVLIAVTPAQNMIQSRKIIRFRHHKQRLSFLTLFVVYQNKTKKKSLLQPTSITQV